MYENVENRKKLYKNVRNCIKPLVFGHFMGNDLYGYIQFYTFLHIFIHLKKLKFFLENFLI